MAEISACHVMALEQDMTRKYWLVKKVKSTEDCKTRQKLEKHVKHGKIPNSPRLRIQLTDLIVTIAETQQEKTPSIAM
jgi:hypothetical protein